MKIYLSLAISVLVLTGCANMQAQQEEKQIFAECQEKWKAPKFDVLRGKLSAFEKNTSTRYILVEDKVAESEKELLLKYADLKDECATRGFDFALKYIPWVLPALAESRERGLISFSELYNGRVSYGEFNRLGAQSYVLYLERWQKLQAEYARLGIAAQRNQIQASQNLLQAAQLLSTPAPQLQNNVVHTNCHWFGRQIQCTSF